MQITFARTPAFIRPFADIGTLAYRRLLLLPVWPFTKFASSEIYECKLIVFKTEEQYNLRRTSRRIPIGSVWDAHWLHHRRTGSDGRSMFIMTPKGPWFIDGRSSTCTRPNDENHRCWVRHGSPETKDFHVDKKGNTCESGAGSLRHDSYHARLMCNNLIRIAPF